jgi:type IV pilus assembly protein PilQ
MRSIRTCALALAVALTTMFVRADAAPQSPPPPASSLAQFSGSPIDVDYQGANLRTVLRQLSEIGGINLVIDPSVPTDLTVDLRLTQVPWDQVMNIVLRTGQLASEINGPVVRVLSRAAQTQELTLAAAQRKASEAAPELDTAQIRLNYATAADMKKLLEDARVISERGTVEFDERSNMLIVRDLTKNIEDVRSLVSQLDKPQPQVEIEAKIIQTSRDTARELGVQWGLNGRASAALGNTTALAFPNNGSVSGRVQGQSGPQSQGPTDVRGSGLDQTSTGVNLAVPGATSAIGLSLGAINGAFNLDLALSALQSRGKVKILSTPRITTQNNQQAEITQGFQVPYQTVANNTVTLQFKDAALKLTVTPQITGANTVIMHIDLENSQPDFVHAPMGNPSITTQRASTQLQVDNGVTTVIGGILQTTDTNTEDSTPGLSKIPLFGWLFKHTNDSSQSKELLIFITPRIIQG